MDTQRLVIRKERPRVAVLYGSLAVVALLLLWGAFEAGRASGGFFLARWYAERSSLVARADALAARVAELEAGVAGADIARRVDSEAYAQVERSLADLQAQLGEQAQELAFYRGIVSPGDGSAGLRVQRLLVVPGEQPHHYRLRIVLVQAGRQDARISGRVELLLEGQRDGRPVSLPFAAVAPDAKPLDFSFRYFQEVEAELQLPADFEPQRVQVEVRPRDADAPVRQTYPWKTGTA